MDEQQKERLVNLLHHCKVNIPYYKSKIPELSIDNVEEIFNSLPIIKKEDIRKNYVNYLDKRIEWSKYADVFCIANKSFNKDYRYQMGETVITAEYTSGTTGIPFVIVKTESERIILGRTLWKLRALHGNTCLNNMFKFMHNSNGMQDFPFEKKFSYEHKVKEMEYLSKSKYTWWHIYPGMLSSYSDCIRDKNIEFVNLKGIECNGAYISEQETKYYESLFDCKIVNNYGTREVWNIAYSGVDGKMYPNEDVIVEIVDENFDPVIKSGEYGSLVVTSLNLKTMPFIRYYIGDCVCICNDNRSLNIMPKRGTISDTNINGNQFFRDVIIDLMEVHNLKNMQSINITENTKKNFTVNVVGYYGEHAVLEKKFLECLTYYSLYDASQWKFRFVYDNEKVSKNLFTSLVN